MKRFLFLMVVLLALLLLGGVASAADTPLVLKGRVTDENGLPVGSAQVKPELAGEQTLSTVSDDAGFSALSPGEYAIRIEKQVFLFWRIRRFDWTRIARSLPLP